MTYATVQGILKNTDLLLDAEEIRSIVVSARSTNRVVEVHAGRGTVHDALLADIRVGDSLTLTLTDAETGNRDLHVGRAVTLHFHMGGYSLESRLECLEQVGDQGLRVSYPAMFRVHSKRQVSRFSIPMNMTCLVEMGLGESGMVRGELQDLNLEGLSFLGEPLAGEMPVNAAVRLRLVPTSLEDSPMELTGILRFSGREGQGGGAVPRYRHSVQVTGALDPELFRCYFNKISTCSHGWFRSAVISAESYRQTTSI
ncbi:MAG: hypothetical protein G8237_11635 [Magnetococcales bacterium]|nr:hypothetical protein [Magnetococcales bacterium]